MMNLIYHHIIIVIRAHLFKCLPIIIKSLNCDKQVVEITPKSR